jgi:hypothetical protein
METGFLNSQNVNHRGPKGPRKPALAFACPHTDRPNLAKGYCRYCYDVKRRNPEKSDRLLALQTFRELAKSLGITVNRATDVKRRYNLLPENYAKQLKEQNNSCKACKQPFAKGFHTSPQIDHAHYCCAKTPTCGKCNRGIICGKCNIVLGFGKNFLAFFLHIC